MNIEHEILKNRKSMEVYHSIINDSKTTITELLNEFSSIGIPFDKEQGDGCETHKTFCYFDKHNKCLSALFTGFRFDTYKQVVVCGVDDNGNSVGILLGYVNNGDIPTLLEAALSYLENEIKL